MKILVIGGGGREHALIWKLSQSSKVQKLYCAPGNAGIGEVAQNITLAADDIEGLLEFATDKSIDLTIVGPEQPLALGIVDIFQEKGLRIFGPNKKASQFESSKAFSKMFMDRHHLPTAKSQIFDSLETALKALEERKFPLVIKADGLAAGKGVKICQTKEEAKQAVSEMMQEKVFGESGSKVVIEDFLEGEELSYLVLLDGKSFLPLASSQDHKALNEGDTGPNTGGMGAYSPAPLMTQELETKIQNKILLPFINGLENEKIDYQGVLYIGVMVVEGEPYVLEFNVRFGDPETQPLMMRLETDLVDVFEACVSRKLEDISLEWKEDFALIVVLAAKGYPGKYEKGKTISGLKSKEFIFHAGTKKEGESVVTNGGRVLSVGGLGKNLQKACDNAYENVSEVSWDGCFYRKDIGAKGLLWI